MTYRALAAALLLAACAATPDASWEVRARERGAGVIAPFKQRLLAELTQGLAPGPEHALEVCRARAPQIAAEASLHGARAGARATSCATRRIARQPGSSRARELRRG